MVTLRAAEPVDAPVVRGAPDVRIDDAIARWEDDGGSLPIQARVPVRAQIIDAVRRWWAAWARGDLAAIASMVTSDYIEGTEMRRWRSIGVDALVESAGRFFESSSIDRWTVSDPVVHVLNEEETLALCSYRFSISGLLRGTQAEFKGFATDILVRRARTWKFFSHFNTFDTAA